MHLPNTNVQQDRFVRQVAVCRRTVRPEPSPVLLNLPELRIVLRVLKVSYLVTLLLCYSVT